MHIGIPKEQLPGEARIAATPQTVGQLLKLGFTVSVESGAGKTANFEDQAFIDAGATIQNLQDVWQSDLILKFHAPSDDEIAMMKEGATIISYIYPAQHKELLEKLAAKNITVMAMDCVPRISRAQSLDALSSMSNIAGYRSVIEAANQFGRFFTGQVTAAGKVPPAKILIIGAGVAGLAAIGTAVSLGAIVRAFDTRPEVAEQIHSMGADFLELDFEEEAGSGDGYAKQMSAAFIEAEMALFAEQAKDVDIIITTALIPGKPAPKLITKEMVESMKPGSVVIDLAAITGGNCEMTKPGEVFITDNNVRVVGYTDLANRMPAQASQLYGTNIVNLLKLLAKEKNGELDVNFDDVVIRGVTVVKDSAVTWPAPPIQVSAQQQKPKVAPVAKPEPKPMPAQKKYGILAIILIAFFWLANSVPESFLAHFTVFALSCVVGYYVVWNVSHSLHTPLMSVTNAISGIILVGAILQVGDDNGLITAIAFVAILIASINIFGGFFVTQRMLKMFQRGGK